MQLEGAPTLMIVPDTPGNAMISWTPDTGTNWVLLQTLSLSPASWGNSSNGWTNPIVVPATLPTKSCPLHKPQTLMPFAPSTDGRPDDAAAVQHAFCP